MKLSNLKGALIATAVYIDGEQRGMNNTVKLPEISPKTSEIPAAGGTIDFPVWQQIQAMELSVTFHGVSKDLLQSLKPNGCDIMINLAQQDIALDGSTTPEGIKVMARVIPKVIPSIEATPGEPSQPEVTFTVLNYKLYLNGETYCDIDPVNYKCVINGVDLSEKVKALL